MSKTLTMPASATLLLHHVAGPIEDDDNYEYDDFECHDEIDYETEYVTTAEGKEQVPSLKRLVAPAVDPDQCSICYSEDVVLYHLDECSHQFCTDCLSAYIKIEMESSPLKEFTLPRLHREDNALVVSIMNVFGFRCPHLGCQKPIKEQYFPNLVGEHHYTQFAQLLQFKRDRINHVAFGKWANSVNVRLCPVCYTQIEKNGGCDHMKCQSCHKDFLWSKSVQFTARKNWYFSESKRLGTLPSKVPTQQKKKKYG